MKDDSQGTRRLTVLELADKYGIRVVGADETAFSAAEEDLRDILSSPTIDRYVSITRSGEFYYLRTWGTRQQAEEYAAGNVLDTIYPELPVAIIDLISGDELRPSITVEWKEQR